VVQGGKPRQNERRNSRRAKKERERERERARGTGETGGKPSVLAKGAADRVPRSTVPRLNLRPWTEIGHNLGAICFQSGVYHPLSIPGKGSSQDDVNKRFVPSFAQCSTIAE